MPRFQTGFRTFPGQGQAGPLFDIRPSSTDFVLLTAIEFTESCSSTVAYAFGLGVSSSVGTPKPSGITFLSEDASTPPAVAVAIDWVVPPGIPTKYFRRATVVGGPSCFYSRWVFPDGIKLVPGASLGLWLLTGQSVNNPPSFVVNLEVDA